MTRLPDAQRLSVGSIRVTALSDGPLPLGLDQLKGIDEADYARILRERHADPATWRSGLNAFVVETGERTVLVDAGVAGNMGEHTGRVMGNFQAAGFAPSDVDTVFVTHMHGDHVAGLLSDGAAAFPDAALRVHAADRAHFEGSDDLATSVLSAYGDRVETFEGEADIAPGLRALPLPGHTPGHCGLQISDGDAGLLIWTDIVHVAPIQLARPEVGTGFDVDVDQARETRTRMLDRVSADGTMIAGSHIGFPGIGWIDRAREGFAFVPARYTHDT